MKFSIFVIILLFAFLLVGCSEIIPEISVPSISFTEESEEVSIEESKEDTSLDFIGKLGSASKIDEKTIIVSIFADDKTTAWNGEEEFKNDMLRSIGIGADWIEQSCANYDATSEFIYDWSKNSDLVYTVKFDEEMVRFDGGMYSVQRQYVLDNIDSKTLLSKYGAQNIIYAFFFNTALENEVNPWTLAYTGEGTCDIEIIDVFCRFDGLICPPASLAHEILHCFGAQDLYYASEGIPQEFVDYCERTESKDIMYTVNMGDEIISELTELAAYYVGLVDECALVEQWGLMKSEHVG